MAIYKHNFSDSTREENNSTLSCNERPESLQNYAEPYEYIDGKLLKYGCRFNPSKFLTFSFMTVLRLIPYKSRLQMAYVLQCPYLCYFLYNYIYHV